MRKSILPCKLFLKEKLDAGGNFIKLKSRLVAGGHRQSDESFYQTHSLTVDISSVFMSLGLFMYLEKCVLCYCRYSCCISQQSAEGNSQYEVTELVVLESPTTAPLVNPDGTMIVRLK